MYIRLIMSSGESILENQDVSGIEQSVEQQAVDSGFAQSVVDEVAQAVVRTRFLSGTSGISV